DEAIDAARVGFHNHTRRGFHLRNVTLRSVAETEGSEFFVDIQGCGTENFGELAPRDTPQQVHLPQAVLGHDESLSLCQVLDGVGANMRDAPAIALDDDLFLKSGNADGA